MTTFRWYTAGESHGSGVLAFMEGLPAGMLVDTGHIDSALARRQGGFGRGKRMEIEKDHVEFLSGVKRGATLGSPLVMLVRNRDRRIDAYRRIARPRPGHADLAGALKYATRDCSDVMERASARETAGRVAAGAVAEQLLQAFGITVFAWVARIGEVEFAESAPLDQSEARRAASPFYSLDPEGDARALELVERLRNLGDSVGGAFKVEARGVPPGLGSPMQWDRKLDGRLAQAVMAIQGIKAVEIGAGTIAGVATGLAFHDPIEPGLDGGYVRPTNRAGGIEGGMSNGEPIVCRATMKPIPSVRQPLPSVDLATGKPAPATYERSDVCSVPAASVVGEAVVALVLVQALLEKTGGDTVAEIYRNLEAYRKGGFRDT